MSPIYKASRHTAQNMRMECVHMSTLCHLSTGNKQIVCCLSTRPLDTQLNAGRWSVAVCRRCVAYRLAIGRWSVAYLQGLSTHSSTQADGASPYVAVCRRMSTLCRLSTGDRQIECRLSTRPLNTSQHSSKHLNTSQHISKRQMPTVFKTE